MTRVLSFSFPFLLFFCLFFTPAALTAAQTAGDENKPKEEARKEEVRKDDVRKNTAGSPFQPGQTLHVDVDLALLNVTVTDPFNRLVIEANAVPSGPLSQERGSCAPMVSSVVP